MTLGSVFYELSPRTEIAIAEGHADLGLLNSTGKAASPCLLKLELLDQQPILKPKSNPKRASKR